MASPTQWTCRHARKPPRCPLAHSCRQPGGLLRRDGFDALSKKPLPDQGPPLSPRVEAPFSGKPGLRHHPQRLTEVLRPPELWSSCKHQKDAVLLASEKEPTARSWPALAGATWQESVGSPWPTATDNLELAGMNAATISRSLEVTSAPATPAFSAGRP